jgi:DNA-binding transcriptional ArsR family regulator
MPVPDPHPNSMTSSERTALYKTMTNSVRRRILNYLGSYGAANSTILATALGESTGTTSYHLRQLAEQHLIEEITERSTGRERWWRPLPVNIPAPAAPAEMEPEERAASQQWNSLRLSSDIELYIKALAEYEGPEGWVQGYRANCYMAKDDLLGFVRDYLGLLRKYGHLKEDAPEDARPMALRFLAVPEPEQPAPGPPPPPDGSQSG